MNRKINALIIIGILIMVCFLSLTTSTAKRNISSARDTQFELSTNKKYFNIGEPVNIIFRNNKDHAEICEYHATIITNILTDEIVYYNIKRIFFYPSIDPEETWTWTWDQKYNVYYKADDGWKPGSHNGQQVPVGVYKADYHGCTTLFYIGINGCYPAPNALYHEFNGKTLDKVTATTYLNGEVNKEFKEYYRLDLERISKSNPYVKSITIGWWTLWNSSTINIKYITNNVELQYELLREIKHLLGDKWYTESVDYIDICPIPS